MANKSNCTKPAEVSMDWTTAGNTQRVYQDEIVPVDVERALVENRTCVMAVTGSTWLTLHQVAKLSGIKYDTVVKHVHQGILKASVPVGQTRPYMVSPKNYNDWMMGTALRPAADQAVAR